MAAIKTRSWKIHGIHSHKESGIREAVNETEARAQRSLRPSPEPGESAFGAGDLWTRIRTGNEIAPRAPAPETHSRNYYATRSRAFATLGAPYPYRLMLMFIFYVINHNDKTWSRIEASNGTSLIAFSMEEVPFQTLFVYAMKNLLLSLENFN